MILVATRILRGRASQEILIHLLFKWIDKNLCDRYVDLDPRKLTTHKHIQSPVSPRYVRESLHILGLLSYPLVVFFPSEPGGKLTTRQLWEVPNSRKPSERSNEQSELGTGWERDFSGAEQSYQPFVGINHPIQPGD